jgi:hypothetical protein
MPLPIPYTLLDALYAYGDVSTWTDDDGVEIDVIEHNDGVARTFRGPTLTAALDDATRYFLDRDRLRSEAADRLLSDGLDEGEIQALTGVNVRALARHVVEETDEDISIPVIPVRSQPEVLVLAAQPVILLTLALPVRIVEV